MKYVYCHKRKHWKHIDVCRKCKGCPDGRAAVKEADAQRFDEHGYYREGA